MKKGTEMTIPLGSPAPAGPPGRMPARMAGWLVAFAAALLLPVVSKEAFYIHTGVITATSAIAVIGLMLIYRVGQLSFCHAAVVGLGAYTGALFSTRWGFPAPLSMITAMAIVGLATSLLGWIILRTRGVYFVLITFATGQVLGLMFLDLESITGGAVGLSGVPAPSMLGFNFDTPFSYYYLALAMLALAIAFATRILESDIGHAFDAVSSNVALAESSGIATLSYQILAFVIGSMLAAGSGVIAAHYTRFVTPGSYEITFMVNLIVMLVLGGRTSVTGAVVGALFVGPLMEILRDMKEMENIIYGVIVLLVLRFVPGGITSIPGRVVASLRNRSGGRP
ncbi:branched-chain amino acid ABC transporter permease [Castellaniella sp. GW247-6E4]|uniref:branched-chain amino acid ABC transporter permease n=1 Tax=Castellaniella sp. GW247-6E4 TaxID=3140380 RepID=UPI003315D7B4